jgi:dienelactone hydrolase
MRTLLTALILLSSTVFAEDYNAFLQHFSYTEITGEFYRVGRRDRGDIKIFDVYFTSPMGGMIPASIVVPPGDGPFPGVLFGHWAMKGSPTRNRTEFLEEAVLLAKSGVVSMLVEAPFAREGYQEDETPLSQKEANSFYRSIMEFRRCIDMLVRRYPVDASRVAFVGHSFSAGVGGVLAGVDKRIKAYVLMAGVLTMSDYLMSNEPEMVKWREEVGPERLKQYLQKNAHLDPVHYLPHIAPAALFLQNARNDGGAGEKWARRALQIASEPKTLKIYESDHALNAEARRDRIEFLRAQLKFAAVSEEALKQLPDTK